MLRQAILLTGLVLLAGQARAHGTLPGGGGFNAGVAHPFLAWEHLLALLGLGLLLGRHTSSARRPPLAIVAFALCLGMGLGTEGFAWPHTPVVILGLGLALGLLVAAALTVPAALLVIAALATGLAVGADTGVPPPVAPELAARLAPYLGVLTGVILILINAMALAATATRAPFSIGIRVAGSWIAAAALLVLALQIRHLAEGG